MFLKNLILVLLSLTVVNATEQITGEEIIRRATEISNRIMPTRLKYHQLTQMWAKGEKYCLGKPRLGEGDYSGIYVQELLNKVPSNGVCIFAYNENSFDFKINKETKELTREY